MSDMAETGVAPGARGGTAGAVSLAGVRAAVNGVALWCPDDSPAVTGVVAADLMSDVLVDARPGHVLVTGLVRPITCVSFRMTRTVGIRRPGQFSQHVPQPVHLSVST